MCVYGYVHTCMCSVCIDACTYVRVLCIGMCAYMLCICVYMYEYIRWVLDVLTFVVSIFCVVHVRVCACAFVWVCVYMYV